MNGELAGSPLYEPDIHTNQRTEAVVFTSSGRQPFLPLSRPRFLASREDQIQKEITGLLKFPDSQARANQLASLEALKAQFAAAREAMTPAERRTWACVKDIWAPPDKVFVTEAEGGHRLATLDGESFTPHGPRDEVRIITVYWRWDEKDPAKTAATMHLKEKLDFDALKRLLAR